MKRLNEKYILNYDYKLKETRTMYYKKGNKWIETEKITKEINKDYYNNIITDQFYHNISRFIRYTKGYTKAGTLIVKVSAISPDGNEKTVREFEVI